MKVPAAPWSSLDRKLPLLITAAIIATVAVFSAGAYHLVQRVLLDTAGERLLGVSAPIALSLQESARRQRTRYANIARDPAISRFLSTGRDREAALHALARAYEAEAMPRPPARIELRNAAGAVVLDTLTPGAPASLAWAERMIATGGAQAGQTLIAPLFAEGDAVVSGSIVAVPAPEAVGAAGDRAGERAVMGYIIDSRAVLGTGVRAVRDLVGKGAAFVVGSPDEGVWTDLEGTAAPPPRAAKPGAALAFDSSARGPGVGAATAIAGTPWMLWVQQPRDVVLAPMHDLIGRLALPSLLIVVLAALGAWMLSRQVTGPIVALADAADRVAADAGAAPRGAVERDEIARLRHAFDRMSTRVSETTEQLESLVAERTDRLEVALGDLEIAQQELVKKERLAMLGQLASAVGHELRNPLGVMTNALYVIEQCSPDAPPMVREYVDLIRGQISASERIVGDLLDTARVRAPVPESVDLREVVDAQLRHLGPLGEVVVDVQLPAYLQRVRMDPLQLSQIIFNLMTNAVQAMPDGGRLTVAAQADEAAARVKLSVSDSGAGIAPDVVERIFEPLFTTKARGLGLGLWVSQNLANANGAVLEAASRSGEGATFTIDMPATVDAASAVS
jgi:signal transduction histidine kinase